MALWRRLRYELGRIRVRLLVVNLIVLLVPIAGLEFARLHERQLLSSLQRDMRNQAVLVRSMLEEDRKRGVTLADPSHREALTRAAATTRTRVRVLGASGTVLVDSHSEGPPEGPERAVPSLGRSVRDLIPPAAARLRRLGSRPGDDGGGRGDREHEGSFDDGAPNSGRFAPDGASLGSREGGDLTEERWPPVPDRREVRDALGGEPSAYTRIRARHPAVLLFVAEPVRADGEVVGVVYAVRSTQPVMMELYRIRRGLIGILVVALGLTLFISLLLAWTISRPLAKLSHVARRLARGEREAAVPIGGGGEIRELGESVAAMTDELSMRARHSRELAADIAHEFKSPLTSIRGAAELLADGAADDPVARERFLRNITLDANRLSRLVSRLLELSRIEAADTEMSELDLESLLGRLVGTMRADGSAIELRYDARRRWISGRASALETAFRNLLDNAVRFSPEDEPVEVSVRDGADRSTLEVDVSDRGAGIPPALRQRVFDRFFTTDAERSGTGLGLAIVRSVVTAHGGTVEVVDGDDAGATFRVRLPVRQDARR